MPKTWLTPHGVVLAVAVGALLLGIVVWITGHGPEAHRIWAIGTWPALLLLVVEIAREIRKGEPGVDIIAALSMGGALLLGETLAGVVIAVMFAGGNVLEEYAQGRAARELSALLGRAPRVAHREDDGNLVDIPVDQVAVGDTLLVKQGEVLPVDGKLLDPAAVLDEAALTGESLPVGHERGAALRSGTVNAGPPFRFRADTTAATSVYAAIVRLVEAAQSEKAPFVRLADRWSLAFLALTLAIAGATWLFTGDAVRALAVLVVATPCPLILAAPVAIVAGISAAARRGVLVKGGGALETLARAKIVMLDKTGTLTTGTPRVVAVEAASGQSPERVLRLAASLDQMSQHVLAAPIVAAGRARGLDLEVPSGVQEVAGMGISGSVQGCSLRLGRLAWVAEGSPPPTWAETLTRRARREGASTVFLRDGDAIVGGILLADELRTETPRALRHLHATGVSKIVMVSGDRLDVAEMVASALGIDSVLADRTPQDKVDAVRAERAGGVTLMVGDGINDAPALAAADVGVAMGARGAGAASEAADVVLLVDKLDRLAVAIEVARHARSIALQSVLAGIALSTTGMLIAAAGFLPPLGGALFQEAIDIAVILNALRARSGGVAAGPKLREAEARTLVDEHRHLLPVLDRMRTLADRLGNAGTEPDAVLRRELTELEKELREQVLAHEEADESKLHPGIALLLGGKDPMAAISRTHREIAHLGRRFARLVDDLGPDIPPDDRGELRRVLYTLEAILRLHFDQEDEIYESVAGEPEEGALKAAA
ncbi:MAG: heavy metal translocating P-type ATPase [Geminicoccaceae bacterium]